MLVLSLEENMFRKEEYILTPRSIERKSIRVDINDCEVINVHVNDLKVVNIIKRNCIDMFVCINNMLYPITNDTTMVTCILYKDKLYHTVLHDPEDSGYINIV